MKYYYFGMTWDVSGETAMEGHWRSVSSGNRHWQKWPHLNCILRSVLIIASADVIALHWFILVRTESITCKGQTCYLSHVQNAMMCCFFYTSNCVWLSPWQLIVLASWRHELLLGKNCWSADIDNNWCVHLFIDIHIEVSLSWKPCR